LPAAVSFQESPRELLRAARVRLGGVKQVVKCLFAGRLAGGLELEFQVFQKVDPADRRELHVGSLAEDRLIRALEHHLQCVTDRPREHQRDVIRARTHQR
jgi:hypothetical protein